jgi:hypothetical protein
MNYGARKDASHKAQINVVHSVLTNEAVQTESWDIPVSFFMQ